MKFVCKVCGYVFSVENYEPDYLDVMEMIPDDFECPNCGAFRNSIEPDEQ